MMIKTRVVRIGNSQGIRLSKQVLEESQLPEEVEVRAEPGRIVVSAARGHRDGWAVAAQAMHDRDDDRMLDEPVATHFDEHEWRW